MRSAHPYDGFLAEALDREDGLSMPTRKLVRGDTNLQDVMGVCLPVNSQGSDGHHPAT